MFSSLLLANYEQQMQFDPTAAYSAFEARNEDVQEKLRKKVEHTKIEAKLVEETKIPGIKEETDDEIESQNGDSTECDNASEILLNVDSFVSRFFFAF